MHTNSPNEGAVYTGSVVADEQGREIGKVVDVVYDDDTTLAHTGSQRRPTWLVVDPGLLRAAHYLPVAGTYRTEHGTIVTPWDRDWVRAAAKASGDHIMNRDQREKLLHHYSLAE